MSIKLYSNVTALAAQRQLGKSTFMLESSLERLSSGLRINRASDDAASVSIAEQLRADARVFAQAIRNINDGVSALSLMEGALSELGRISIRQKELAQQSANSVYSPEQRRIFTEEANTLVSEYNRIVDSVEFNEIKLLDKSTNILSIQAGYGEEATYTFSIAETFARVVGDGTFTAGASFATGSEPSDLVTGDFNGDGLTDVATADVGAKTVSVLLSNGDGSFKALQAYQTEAAPIAVTLGDFNGDGILDLATADYGSSGLGETTSILLGNGDGTFLARTTIASGLGPVHIAVGDINNDGLDDVVTSRSSTNFTSGLPETTYAFTQNQGQVEINNVTLAQAATAEVSTVTTSGVQTGTAEERTITAIATSTSEVTTVNTVAPDNGTQEVTFVDGIAVATQEVSLVDTVGPSNGTQEITFVNGIDVATQEVTEITAIEAADYEETQFQMLDAASISDGDYFRLSTAAGDYYVWYDTDGDTLGDPDPDTGGSTGIRVDISGDTTAADVAASTAAAIDAEAGFLAQQNSTLVNVQNAAAGAATDATTGTMGGGFTASTIVQGVTSELQAGDYFTINAPGRDYNVYFRIARNGIYQGSDPGVSTYDIVVDLNGGENATEVATAIAAQIGADSAFGAGSFGATVTVTNDLGGAVTDAADGTVGGTFGVSTSVQGIDSTLARGDYFTISSPTKDYHVYFTIGGIGSDPGITANAIAVDLAWGANADAVEAAIAAEIDDEDDFSAIINAGRVEITNADRGVATDGNAGNVGGAFSVTTNTQGIDDDIQDGDYFRIYSTTGSYYVWYDKDGLGDSDPNPDAGASTGIRVDISSDVNADDVAASTAAAIDALGDFVASAVGSQVTITNAIGGNASNGVDITVENGSATGGTFSVATSVQGVTSALADGDYFNLYAPAENYYVWFDYGNDDVGDPTPGSTEVRVAVDYNMDADAVGIALRNAINAQAGPNLTAAGAGSSITVTNDENGAVSDASDVNIGGGFNITTTTQGITNGLLDGDYFYIYTPGENFYVWFDIGDDDLGNPGVAGTGIEVDLAVDADANAVAAAIRDALNSGAQAAHDDINASATGNVVTIQNNQGGAVTNTVDGNVGPVFSFATTVAGVNSTIEPGDYFVINTPTDSFYVWFEILGTDGTTAYGSDPNPLGDPTKGIKTTIHYNDSAATIAAAVAAAINSDGDAAPLLNASVPSGSTVQIAGEITDPTQLGDGSVAPGTVSGLPISVVQNGYTPPISDGQYFRISSPTTTFHVWFDTNNDGAGDPFPGDNNDVRVVINDGDVASAVATAIRDAINSQQGADFTATASSNRVTITNDAFGIANDAVDVTVGGSFYLSISQDGIETRVDTVNNSVYVPDHGFETGKEVELTTDGTLPGGLSTGTTYYLIRVDASHVKFAANLSDALAGTAINLTNFGVGTHGMIEQGNVSGAGVNFSSGNGGFTLGSAFQLNSEPYSMTLRDVNFDDYLDLLVVDGNLGNAEVRLGRGDGTFATAAVYSVGADPRSITSGDFNGDGMIDLATANCGDGSGNTVSVLLGRGDGSFYSAGTYAVGTGPLKIVAGDLTGDGVDDLTVANYDSGAGTTATVLIADGNGSFKMTDTLATGTAPSSIGIADINSDGVPDVVTANRADNTVSVSIANTTTTTFSSYMNLGTVESARNALDTISETLERINATIAQVGAAQSRLQVAANNLAVRKANVVEAASRLLDVDVAEEAANLIRSRILQQASAAVLSQANIEPTLALELLKFK